jgi:hypothetical protein
MRKTFAFRIGQPMMIVRRTISKNGHQHFTFVEETHGTRSILDYLNKRRHQNHEVLTLQSPLVKPNGKRKAGFRFVTTKSVGDEIRKAVRRSGSTGGDYFNPNLLRNFAADRAYDAEEAWKIIPDYRQFLFGHTGSMLTEYSIKRNRLAPEKVEKMRAAFERVTEYMFETPSTTASRSS